VRVCVFEGVCVCEGVCKGGCVCEGVREGVCEVVCKGGCVCVPLPWCPPAVSAVSVGLQRWAGPAVSWTPPQTRPATCGALKKNPRTSDTSPQHPSGCYPTGCTETQQSKGQLILPGSTQSTKTVSSCACREMLPHGGDS